jgi:hypothetical protein
MASPPYGCPFPIFAVGPSVAVAQKMRDWQPSRRKVRLTARSSGTGSVEASWAGNKRGRSARTQKVAARLPWSRTYRQNGAGR